MSGPDLNLLVALDVLLAEGSVARAARRLHLSASAMSRTLARLRDATGDPLLVRSGRGLVPTPRALALRERVGRIVDDARSALRPDAAPDFATLARTFTLRTSDGFVENFGAALVARVAAQAPGVRLRFVQKSGRDGAALRDGSADLDTGVVGDATHPELRSRVLFDDRFVGVARKGHALARARIAPARYAACAHVLVSRDGRDRGIVDDALQALGLERRVAAIVGGFAAAIALARASDLVAAVPERHTRNLRVGMFSFPLPVTVPAIAVSMLWHPRMDGDFAHRWLRECVREVCTASPVGTGVGRKRAGR